MSLAAPGKVKFNHDKFRAAARRVFDAKGFTPEMLDMPEVADLIEETYNALNGAVDTAISTETPDELTNALRSNTFIFSGFKSYHSLAEVGLSLTRDDGTVKSFEEFSDDVERVDSKYNTNYLYAEYNHAVHSAQMAVKWNDFVQSGDEYNLQYRTAGDDRVREAHAALDGTTLPPSDKFWDSYLPPNGWNCRCNVVQVLREDYPRSNSDAAVEAGNACTAEPKQQIFRFNPGKKMSVFPPKHPYLPKGCGSCSSRLAYDPTREACRVCILVNRQNRIRIAEELYRELKDDPNYTDVKIDRETGGLRAIEVGHKKHPNDQQTYFEGLTGDEIESEFQELVFKNGHSVILLNEDKTAPDGNTYAALDMQFDGIVMELKTPTVKKRHYGSVLFSKNGQLVRYNSRPDIQRQADTVCLYFRDPSMYSDTCITEGMDWLRNKIESEGLNTVVHLKRVICVLRMPDGTAEIRKVDV